MTIRREEIMPGLVAGAAITAILISSTCIYRACSDDEPPEPIEQRVASLAGTDDAPAYLDAIVDRAERCYKQFYAEATSYIDLASVNAMASPHHAEYARFLDNTVSLLNEYERFVPNIKELGEQTHQMNLSQMLRQLDKRGLSERLPDPIGHIKHLQMLDTTTDIDALTTYFSNHIASPKAAEQIAAITRTYFLDEHKSAEQLYAKIDAYALSQSEAIREYFTTFSSKMQQHHKETLKEAE